VFRVCACQVGILGRRVSGFGVVHGVEFSGGLSMMELRKSSVRCSRKTVFRMCLQLPCIDSEFPCVFFRRLLGRQNRVKRSCLLPQFPNHLPSTIERYRTVLLRWMLWPYRGM